MLKLPDGTVKVLVEGQQRAQVTGIEEHETHFSATLVPVEAVEGDHKPSEIEALRRAVKTWQLDPHFVAPSEEPRTRITEWRARTSLAVDAGAVTALLRAHDPLDVLSKWTLIRGQVEPRVWAEIDAILIELGHEQILPCTTRA